MLMRRGSEVSEPTGSLVCRVLWVSEYLGRSSDCGTRPQLPVKSSCSYSVLYTLLMNHWVIFADRRFKEDGCIRVTGIGSREINRPSADTRFGSLNLCLSDHSVNMGTTHISHLCRQPLLYTLRLFNSDLAHFYISHEPYWREAHWKGSWSFIRATAAPSKQNP